MDAYGIERDPSVSIDFRFAFILLAEKTSALSALFCVHFGRCFHSGSHQMRAFKRFAWIQTNPIWLKDFMAKLNTMHEVNQFGLIYAWCGRACYIKLFLKWAAWTRSLAKISLLTIKAKLSNMWLYPAKIHFFHFSSKMAFAATNYSNVSK